MTSTGPSHVTWKTTAVVGYVVIILTFGFGGGWAAVAEIDQAVVAPAVVVVETNRKTVAHLEGGIVKAIFAKEGEAVKQGDVLFEMERVQAQANNQVLMRQLASNLALEARLVAERDDRETIAWPAEIEATEASSARLIADQTEQFGERQKSLKSQIAVLESRIAQFDIETSGLAIEKDSTEKQVGYINEELVSLRKLLQSQLVSASRVFAMERERTRLEGVIGKLISDSAKVHGNVLEVRNQIHQIQQKFKEDVATNLLEARQRNAELREKIAVAGDVLRRVEIVAPRSGTVQNLKVFSAGQVVRSAEPLLEIVPEGEDLIVQARFSPTDIDSVHSDQVAEIKFPSFHSRQLPFMKGTLRSLSRDRINDESNKQQYYLGVISLNRSDIPKPYRSKLRSGMPAEVIVKAGERTVMQYIMSPLASSLRKTFIEQ